MNTYEWHAQYNDGTTLSQIDQNGDKHAYLDIDRSKLVAFSLMLNTIPVFTILFDNDGEKLIWTRRSFQVIGQSVAKTFHIIGKKGEFVAAVGDNGQVILRHNFVDDGLFDEVIQ